METKNNKTLQFITQVLVLFAINILTLMLLASFFGEGAKSMSTIYQFGSRGLASTTMLQFLLSSVATVALKNFYFSELILRKLMTLWRTILLLFSILFINLLFIILFEWFSLDNSYAWAGFFLCFGGGAVLSSSFMIIKTKLESRRYDELLSIYKDQHEKEDNNE